MFLYHATDIKNLDSILSGGLLINPPHHNWKGMTDNLWDRMIFLALDAESAVSYVENQDTEPEEIIVLKIGLDSLNPLHIGYDWNNRCEYKRDINSVVYAKDIPPQEIQVCDPKNEPIQDIENFKRTPLYEIVLSVFDEEVETNKERNKEGNNMAFWGFVICTPYEEEIFSDFGYETEQDAEEAGYEYVKKNGIRLDAYSLRTEQRWSDLD